ncbi:heavy-metal-associated domain-containing protein [Flavisphingomonas formosensis]|uniref:heavy-metal-associated domain-containing protein n=1 Tax=Flavisphingomonas formosensis TaxID=861534 RepID=UPI001E30A854|nr:heavy-metal-associated domain-containing protein [Sphingomonas formosensis]
MNLSKRLLHPMTFVLALLFCGAAAVVAQIEGDRGVPPIDSSQSLEVSGVAVDVAAKDADTARTAAWHEAQRRGWKMLWAKTHGGTPAAAPGLPDSTLDSIVAGIVVEDEQISPTRYIARLGILFDRARTGQLLGVGGQGARSAPMLVIPVEWDGSTPTTFETRNEWQKAWARFRSGGSVVDYVRVSGTGSDPLLLNAAQANRRGRSWWRMLLDQYGAADVLVPEVRIDRSWPGGPATATFTARHGPDSTVLDRFTLRADNSDGIPKMLDEGVQRIDAVYSRAFASAMLNPDKSLVVEQPVEADLTANAMEAEADAAITAATSDVGTGYTLQVDTPDAASVGQAEATLRSVPGVRSAATTSLALGGVSVIRITFQGDAAALRIALTARGWRVEDIGGTLRLRRGSGPTPETGTAPAQ